MSWFDRWLWKRVQRARNMEEREASVPVAIGTSDEVELHSTIRFNITPARGGSVVTVSRYDQRKDNNARTVYVIDENTDIGKRVSEIVTLEMYRS